MRKVFLYVFSLFATKKILNVYDIINRLRKEPRRQVKIYLRRLFLPPPSPVMANIQSILTSESPFVYFTPKSTVTLTDKSVYVSLDVPHTHDVGLPTQFRFKVGPASQPIAGSKPVNCLRRWPITNPTLGLLYTWASTSGNTWYSPNAVSMLTQSNVSLTLAR